MFVLKRIYLFVPLSVSGAITNSGVEKSARPCRVEKCGRADVSTPAVHFHPLRFVVVSCDIFTPAFHRPVSATIMLVT